ncbi:winged helix-turn-helix transcriptional regulator [Metallosphaera tengchongensis]|uniref:Winged helix-turn-helix transcriptional regulator n=1 Tax=Metallosphaera tengchongensis TaxID=1532350 RepID=A0A6N0NU40_9CREN|nr:winged helix-turn-helix domain-containing protein [Metallosphaera tengchongensis]QKR00222.1 winged helix-turn-helix transcriptional regulator [Metallosphaera tengchongensis]
MKSYDLDPKSTDVEILEYLERRGRDRASNISKATNLNPKTVWQSLQRLTEASLVTKDEFDIYYVTDEGKKIVDKVRSDRKMKMKYLAAKIARHVEELDESEIDTLEKLEKEISK